MEQKEVKYRDDSVSLYCCEALTALRSMPPNSIDAIVTDPPYSSGGQFRGDRSQKTSTKYSLTGTAKIYPEFSGDNMDQRSFTLWLAAVATECRRVCRPGGGTSIVYRLAATSRNFRRHTDGGLGLEGDHSLGQDRGMQAAKGVVPCAVRVCFVRNKWAAAERTGSRRCVSRWRL